MASLIHNNKSWFEYERCPSECFEKANVLRKQMGSERFFNEPGISWLREAWTIGKYGSLISAAGVWLARNDPPDGYIRLGNQVIPIEITEAMAPDRKRGEEYKNKDQPQIEIIPTAMHFPQIGKWVAKSVYQKLTRASKYPENTLLLVHASALCLFHEPEELEYEILSELPEPSGNIEGIAVLHGEKIYNYKSRQH